jgi:hypothetical protein
MAVAVLSPVAAGCFSLVVALPQPKRRRTERAEIVCFMVFLSGRETIPGVARLCQASAMLS